jgi:hypothetical protein
MTDDVNNPVHVPDECVQPSNSSSPATLRDIIERAFHYRGDVTIRRRAPHPPIEGYLFDRSFKPTDEKSLVRIISKRDNTRHTIALADIESIDFTGKDTAAGKSFDTWVRKYVEKKLKGETASILDDSLEEE